ncbi:MAG: amino acid permease [Ignavibacteriaceae bacterium]
MLPLKKSRKLKKELKLLDVYSIATGTTLSAGFFLLPGLAAIQAGPALVAAYLIAAIPLIPGMFSIIELATAMPRAGGIYYFLDRTLGPAIGTIGGIGTWLALILKVSFALIGMSAYLEIFFPGLPIIPISIGIAILLGIINLFGSKKSGGFQTILVFSLLFLLTIFIVGGIPEINREHFHNFFSAGFTSILSTSGLVFVSYIGITKVASLSEEIQNPERNIPLGVILSIITTLIIYALGTIIMVGVLPMEELKGSMTPVAASARIFYGKIGAILITIAALFAFISVSNAGTLSASRYPLAMSRDHIFPKFLRKLNTSRIPFVSVILTVSIIIISILIFNPTRIAKLASSFQLLMFMLSSFAVIVMRESRIQSYDPGYKSPLYPWMQIFGILTPLVLIFEMGWIPVLFSIGLIFIGLFWFQYYAKNKVTRSGAIFHVFERLGHQRYDALDSELREILKEKGLRKEDPFDDIVTRSFVVDLNEKSEFEKVADDISIILSKKLPFTPKEITTQILEGTRIGATPVTHGVALPHFRSEGIDKAIMVLVRSKAGVEIKVYNPLTQEEEDIQIVNAIFFLVSPEDNPSQHLRILAQIAGRVDDEDFMKEWYRANSEQELKETLLHNERFLSLVVNGKGKTSELVNKSLKEISLPDDALIAMISREDNIIIPKGETSLQNGDRLTIIGNPKSISFLRKKFI